MSEYADFIDIEIAFPFPTPQVVAGRIDQLANDLRDMTPALEASKGAIVADVEEHFTTKTGPDGTSWQDWSEPYGTYAAQRNVDGILQRDNFLHDAAVDESNYDVLGNDIFINTGDFPPYWRIQQLGGPIMSGSSSVRRYGQRRRGEPTTGNIPPRPYLGMSDQARRTVTGVFDLWMEGTIASFIRNPMTGHTQPIYTIPGGRPTFGRAIR